MNEESQKVKFQPFTESPRTVNHMPVAFRFKGGQLQYANEWHWGTQHGLEWVNVPTVPADAPDME